MSIRFGFSPIRHTRISTNARGNVRLGVGAHRGPWSITTGKTLVQGSRRSRRHYARTHDTSGATIKPVQRTWPWIILSAFVVLGVASLFSSGTELNMHPKPVVSTTTTQTCTNWDVNPDRTPMYICLHV